MNKMHIAWLILKRESPSKFVKEKKKVNMSFCSNVYDPNSVELSMTIIAT